LRKMCALENAHSSDQQEESAFSNSDVCVKRELRKGVMWSRRGELRKMCALENAHSRT
jgi:hypothetical protein